MKQDNEKLTAQEHDENALESIRKSGGKVEYKGGEYWANDRRLSATILIRLHRQGKLTRSFYGRYSIVSD